MKLKYKFKYIYIAIAFFIGLSTAHFIFIEKYIHNSEKNYTNGIKKELNLLINVDRLDILELAKSFSRQKSLISILKNKQYDKLYQQNIFKIPKKYLKYKDFKIHIADKDKITRYLSWTTKSLGESIYDIRKDLDKLYLHPTYASSISIGKFDITIKGIAPIYDGKNFLGVIEVIKNFNHIANELQNSKIYTILLINKKYKNNIKYLSKKNSIDGYIISVNTLDNKLLSLLKKSDLASFISNKEYSYVVRPGNMIEGYFLISVPIKNRLYKYPLGFALLFIKDLYHLAIYRTIAQVTSLLMALIFLFLVYAAFKEHQKSQVVIKNLKNIVKEEVDHITHLIYTDPLTGAFRKVKFIEDLKNNRDKKAVMFNIRNFSKINEAFGFNAGDEVLKICTNRVKKLLKRDIYRIDADEFIFFSVKTKQDIKSITNYFINNPVKILKENINIKIKFSFGVVRCDTDKVISKLSFTAKEAKKCSFALFKYYRDKDHNTHENFIKFNSIVYDAIFKHKNTNIIPFFQPIHDNKINKIVKYESLARLKTKDKIYTPNYFLDIVQSSGFMYKMTELMIKNVLSYVATLEKEIDVSINITEEDLNTRRIKATLEYYCEQYNIQPNRVIVEVLEGVTTTGTKNNIKQLKEIKKSGFKIAIDDFGVEYSNFERISEMDINCIKIDAKYIKNIHTNKKSYQIVKAITNFAHNLDIQVVAEFVENEEIYNKVKELGIDFSQGYFFGKPSQNINL